jgi:hypothetical protein
MSENKPNIKPEVVQAVKALLEACNTLGSRKDIAASIHQAVTTEHRTIQQSFWSALLLAQIQYADNSFDLRNESAVKLAKLVKETAVQNNLDMGLPLI